MNVDIVKPALRVSCDFHDYPQPFIFIATHHYAVVKCRVHLCELLGVWNLVLVVTRALT